LPHYRLTSAAADDVVTILENGIEQFGVDHAARYRDGLVAAFVFLAEYPQAARVRDDLPRSVRVHRYRSHVIIYRMQDDGSVLIARVCHGREDWQADLTSH